MYNQIFSKISTLDRLKSQKSIQSKLDLKTERFKFHVKEVRLHISTYSVNATDIIIPLSRHQYTVSCALSCSCIALGLISTSFTAFHRVCARAVAQRATVSISINGNDDSTAITCSTTSFFLAAGQGRRASRHLDLLTSTREYPSSNHAEI